MKKLLVVAAFLAIGAVVYAKVIRDTPEEAACERLHKLCGDTVPVGECTKEMDKAADVFGEKAMDKAVDCMDDADSCAEAAGCLVGAGKHMVDEFKQGVERGIRD
jgi:hypothetical protein